MKLENVKSKKGKIPRNKNLLKKIGAGLISVAVIVVAFFIINQANTAARDTVPVIRVRMAGGIPERGVITRENIVVSDVILREHTEDMLTVDELDLIINSFAARHLRDGAIIYRDEIVDEIRKKNEWLYHMSEDMELLTIPFNHMEAGGDILTPGDRIRVRVIYVEEIPSGGGDYWDDDYYTGGAREGGRVTRTEILFESIEVMDMLNSRSNSIYEVYREVMRLPEDQRQQVLKSPEFIRSIVPRALILSATSEQIDSYVQYLNATGNKSLLVTILARHEYSIILDQLPILEKEIESWLER